MVYLNLRFDMIVHLACCLKYCYIKQKLKNESENEILICNILSSNKGSGKPVQMHRLARDKIGKDVIPVFEQWQ